MAIITVLEILHPVVLNKHVFEREKSIDKLEATETTVEVFWNVKADRKLKTYCEIMVWPGS